MNLIKQGSDSRLLSGCHFIVSILIILLATGCTQKNGIEVKPHDAIPSSTAESFVPVLPTATIQSVTPTAIPNAINPLTGLAVEDSSLLNLPAMLVSISTFPVDARPQAGLSFAPYIFEVYITEGTTRYLTAFYGEFPAPEAPVIGNCNVRREIFTQTGLIIGNRVWLDTDQNDEQDDWERGVGGVCINLYDESKNLLQQTSTDSNGYYGFNVSAGIYFIAFAKPEGMEFTQKNIGDEDKDSDVDQVSGWSDALDVSGSLLDLDVGLIPSEQFLSTSDLPPAQVGPVRSGRLVYADIAALFKGSCLIYAYASSEVLVELPKCAFVDHNIQGGGYMLDISELRQLAEERRNKNIPKRYKSNTFSDDPPDGGKPGTQLDLYVAWLNQTGWKYDPLSVSYWRYVDDGKSTTAGILHPEVDRLTGRQLQFENVIVLFTEHGVISPTNLDIHLERGLTGKALLFRDGQMYSIQWSTEKNSPIQFRYEDGKLFPLKPGHTWISVVTPQTTVTEKKLGEWRLRFIQPKGSK